MKYLGWGQRGGFLLFRNADESLSTSFWQHMRQLAPNFSSCLQARDFIVHSQLSMELLTWAFLKVLEILHPLSFPTSINSFLECVRKREEPGNSLKCGFFPRTSDPYS